MNKNSPLCTKLLPFFVQIVNETARGGIRAVARGVSRRRGGIWARRGTAARSFSRGGGAGGVMRGGAGGCYGATAVGGVPSGGAGQGGGGVME